jgi:hypothetical protein
MHTQEAFMQKVATQLVELAKLSEKWSWLEAGQLGE